MNEQQSIAGQQSNYRILVPINDNNVPCSARCLLSDELGNVYSREGFADNDRSPQYSAVNVLVNRVLLQFARLLYSLR
jgi:hypothetical protein